MWKIIRLVFCTAIVLSLFAGQCFATVEKTLKLDEDWRLTSELDIEAGNGNIIIIDGQGKYTIYEMSPVAILKNTTGLVKLRNVRVINIAEAPESGTLAALSQAAAAIKSVAAPIKDATSLVLPTVEGFAVAIESSSNPEVIAVNGTITPPSAQQTVSLVFKLTGNGGEAYTASIPTVVPAKSTSTGNGNNDGGGGSSTGGNSTNIVTPAAPTVTVANNNVGSTANTNVSVVVIPTTDTSGRIIASVSQTVMNDIVSAANAAVAAGKTTTAELRVEGNANATNISVSLPEAAFNTLANSNAASFTISTAIAAMTLDQKSLDTINGGTGDVSISVAKVDTAALPSETRTIVGSRPVYDFNITCGTTRITDFNGGSVAISIPYVLKPGEDASAIVIYYIGTDGKLQSVKASSYDAATGRVAFTTTHFSKYAVGYKAINFTDTINHWAKKYIAYLAARNINTGVDGDKFAPDTNITRAQLVKLIASSVDGIDVTKAKAASFTDVLQGQGNTAYINWAAENGIVTGVGSEIFGTDSSITRQDMATIIYRFTQKMGIKLHYVNTQITFDDDGKIASYAKDAVYALQSAGIISGRGGNKFEPTGTATNAEAAKIIASIVQGMAR